MNEKITRLVEIFKDHGDINLTFGRVINREFMNWNDRWIAILLEKLLQKN